MSRRKGFTLVELLVVIGIIAVLIGILMPALSSARRQARRTQCMSALRTIGHAYFIYAQEYKGFWPVAVHRFDAWIPLPGGEELRWYDRIATYITGKRLDFYNQVHELRQSSVIWGCPEYIRREDYIENTASNGSGDAVRPGYGMNIRPLYEKGNLKKDQAYVAAGTPADPHGRYLKQSEWTKPTERALMADTIPHTLDTYGTAPLNSILLQFQPFDAFTTSGSQLWVDASRHAPARATKKQCYLNPYLNMLFCDGSVRPVSVKEAWNAVRNPGFSTAPGN